MKDQWRLVGATGKRDGMVTVGNGGFALLTEGREQILPPTSVLCLWGISQASPKQI